MLYTCELDPLAVAIQTEVDGDNAFNKDHIFYKIMLYGIKSATAKIGQFQWPDEIVDFVNSVEASGGGKVCNLLRGPGELESNSDNSNSWSNINIPLPSKRTRQRRKRQPVIDRGVLTENLKNFQAMASTSTQFIRSEHVYITPICICRDAMAIKPSGDLDQLTNNLVGLTEAIDIDYVEKNPYPDPEVLKEKMYTEAGAIIGTTLDNHCGLLLANDFLTHKTSGNDVFNTLSSACQCIQCCEGCLRGIRSQITKEEQVSCDSVCNNCLENDALCEQCVETHTSIYPQLRACRRCLMAGIQCKKLAVMAVSMDCESNNALAMKMIHQRENIPSHLLLLHAVPDAVHAGKKIYRASANWWLIKDGYRINNVMLRCLRQFDEVSSPLLRPVVSDSALRNRDRMDYGSILEVTNSKVADVLEELQGEAGALVTTTLYPDPFWKQKQKDISSTTDICAGNTI